MLFVQESGQDVQRQVTDAASIESGISPEQGRTLPRSDQNAAGLNGEGSPGIGRPLVRKEPVVNLMMARLPTMNGRRGCLRTCVQTAH